MRFKKNKGQTLIEVIVALGIAVVVSITIYSLSVNSSQFARENKNKLKATIYAQNTIEAARNKRDNNLKTGLAFNNGLGNGGYYFDESSLQLSTTGSATPEPGFTRQINVCNTCGPTTDSVQIIVRVSWGSGGRSVTLSETLTDWRVP